MALNHSTPLIKLLLRNEYLSVSNMIILNKYNSLDTICDSICVEPKHVYTKIFEVNICYDNILATQIIIGFFVALDDKNEEILDMFMQPLSPFRIRNKNEYKELNNIYKQFLKDFKKITGSKSCICVQDNNYERICEKELN